MNNKSLLITLALSIALLLELSALVTLWPAGEQDRMWYVFLLQHAGSSMLLTISCWFLMPVAYRYPRWAMLLLLFNFAFFMPVLGMAGIFVAVLIASLRRKEKVIHPFTKLVLPEFVLSLREPSMKFSQGEIKSRLAHGNIPTPQRLQSLLALQGIPARVSSPLLQGMLGDSSDDIRLVAYGLLDSREKKITAQIHAEQSKLRHAKAGQARLMALKQLAELYWEMVYAGLAQGDLRLHSLNQALSHADEALQLAEHDTGMLFLKGRILHNLKRDAEAVEMLQAAIQCGLPEFRAMPYLVEIAFRQGEYELVQERMNSFSNAQVTPLMKKVVDFWGRRTSESMPSIPEEYAI